MADVLVQLIAPEEENRRAQEEQQVVRTWQPPYFILVVSIIEVCVYLWGDLGTRQALVYDPHHREQVWRFLTYMLLHSSSLHLALNVAIQCLLAAPLEQEQGHVRTGLVYLGGVLGGSLGNSMLEPDLYVMGASGGVYALLISQLANILLNFQALPYKIQRTVAVAVLAFADIAASLYHYFSLGNVCPRISWAAHCSGALAGFLIGLLLFKGSQKRGAGIAWVRVIVWVAAIVLSAAVTAAVVCNLLLPPPPGPS